MCIRSSTVPRGNSFDYTTNKHEIAVNNLLPYVLQCTTETILDLDTPIYPGVKKGDGVNNDCDSAEGEEINNGLGMKALTSWLSCV